MNGLGLCSTQYSSEYMDVDIRRDGYRYTLRFEKGEIVGKLKKSRTAKRIRVQKFIGNPTSKSLRISTFSPNIFLT